jgi:hypothetical protein
MIDELNANETSRAGARSGCFGTSDVYQAAYFVARGRPVIGIEWVTTRAKFVFARDDSFETDLRDFYANVPVPIRDLISAINSTRRMLASAKYERERRNQATDAPHCYRDAERRGSRTK